MAAQRRLELTKGLLLGLLETAYRKRDQVALLSFAGARRTLRVGGRTPMAEALREARQAAERRARITRELQQAIVVVSDGRSNVGLDGVPPLDAVAAEFARLARQGLPVILLDAEEGPVRLGLMAGWARRYGFVCARLAELQGAAGAGRIRIEAVRPDVRRAAGY